MKTPPPRPKCHGCGAKAGQFHRFDCYNYHERDEDGQFIQFIPLIRKLIAKDNVTFREIIR